LTCSEAGTQAEEEADPNTPDEVDSSGMEILIPAVDAAASYLVCSWNTTLRFVRVAFPRVRIFCSLSAMSSGVQAYGRMSENSSMPELRSTSATCSAQKYDDPPESYAQHLGTHGRKFQ